MSTCLDKILGYHALDRSEIVKVSKTTITYFQLISIFIEIVHGYILYNRQSRKLYILVIITRVSCAWFNKMI